MPSDVPEILERSRHNNAIDGVTGLLWTDGERFLQVMEGDASAVDACFQRIQADGRHRDIVVIADRMTGARQFGYWAMAHRTRSEPADGHDARVRRMLDQASVDISAPFLQLLSSSIAT